MTQEQREFHRKVVGHLRLLLPGIVLLSALGYRLPVSTALPPVLLHRMPEGAERQAAEEGWFEGRHLRVELWQAPGDGPLAAPVLWVRLEALEPIRRPDVVLYWSSRSSAFDQPPLGATMLGTWDSREVQSFKLPAQAAYLRGYVVLYSVAERVMVTQVQLPAINP